ncbi:MAG: methyltransferase domain-containing protein [Desulfomonile tiedjei]|nr:methyltransferase domain-containing protein [Desulfomonile tiedjei]
MDPRIESKAEVISLPIGRFEVRMRVPAEQEEHGLRLSCWWGITSASVALSRHIAALDSLAGHKAIELGCGLGLVGITAELSGARVLFTDYVPEALHFAEENCRLNRLREDETDFRLLDWEGPDDVGQFDLILGSEIVYDYFFHGSLIKLIDRILASNGRLILADRKRLVVSRFLGRLIGKGFDCIETETVIRLDGFPDREISIFEITRSRPG